MPLSCPASTTLCTLFAQPLHSLSGPIPHCPAPLPASPFLGSSASSPTTSVLWADESRNFGSCCRASTLLLERLSSFTQNLMGSEESFCSYQEQDITLQHTPGCPLPVVSAQDLVTCH